MGHEHVKVDRNGYVVTVTLDRPGTRNACSMDMWLAIRDEFRAIAISDARVVVLTGANGDFCSGADVVKSENSGKFSGSHLSAMRLLAQSVAAVHDCPAPVIVKVDGVSIGAGFGLALAGDLLYCSERARLCAAFTKLGFSPDYGSSYFLTKRIGVHKAKELVYTAEMMSGARAAELGFVNGVLPAEGLDAKVDEVARQIASGPPIALSMTKRMMEHAAASSLEHALETEALAQNVNLGTDDMKEAFLAFREKRPAQFKGR